MSIISQLLQVLRKPWKLNSWNSLENTWEVHVLGTSYINVKGKANKCP